ncbi:unnamed protein product [Ranitomeya imitator]|uniref:Uncharacterized protein n=1 Tax=Ranitomeya imitator TaxID=111125 RepID=A0ABN9LJP5_9NEOB|nr:unnamed protein product [Ranitomeya imitator]
MGRTRTDSLPRLTPNHLTGHPRNLLDPLLSTRNPEGFYHPGIPLGLEGPHRNDDQYLHYV